MGAIIATGHRTVKGWDVSLVRESAVKQATTEIVGEVRSARKVAHAALETRLVRQHVRLHGSSKTRKGQATRDRIMTAAGELMIEHGGTDFQMSEVSSRCRMSKGALYYYFADKDELIQAIFSAESDDLLASMEKLVSEAATARDALSGLCAEFGRRLRTGSPLALAMTRELAGTKDAVLPDVSGKLSRTITIIAAQLERAKAEGMVAPQVDSELAASYVTGGFLVTSLVSAGTNRLADKDALAESLFDLTMGGVGLPGGHARG